VRAALRSATPLPTRRRRHRGSLGATAGTTQAEFDPEKERSLYKKLSFKVHPDKNHARGAEEAFKKLSEAHQVLSDANLRQQYNVRQR